MTTLTYCDERRLLLIRLGYFGEIFFNHFGVGKNKTGSSIENILLLLSKCFEIRPGWEAGLSGSLHTSRAHCNRTVQIPTFDLSQFIQDNFLESDELIVKIDIEGAEYPVVTKLLEDGSYKYVDKFFIEFHASWSFPTGWNETSTADLLARLKAANLTYDSWEAEGPLVPKSDEWAPKVW